MAKKARRSKRPTVARPARAPARTEPDSPKLLAANEADDKPSRESPGLDPARQTGVAAASDQNAKRSEVPVVGIGASAGGLDAFKRFFSKMPTDSGAAFVLVPHLDPTHESLMVELIGRQTSMPVHEAEEAMLLAPNHVYVIPPNKYLAIVDGRLQLSPPAERHGSPTAIDFFFCSLANQVRERASGVILSGTSNHGTIGLKEIKLAGGMVMVQQPETAEYDQMPRSALAMGLVDFVLPPEEMPGALVKYLRHPYVSGPLEPPVEGASREHLNRILALMSTRARHDFRCYRKNMLLRRVLRRMGLCQLDRMSDYFERLRDDPDELAALQRDLLIGVTAFFRDPAAFQVLEQRVIPELVSQACMAERRAEDQPVGSRACRSVRIWVPACATGEEAYSIAMLTIERLAAEKQPANLQVFATDVDERALETARRGVYSESALAGVSPERRQRFFSKVDADHWQVGKQLRESITFAPQNLLGDAPFSKLNLVSCRNLLIYFEPEVQARAIRLFHFALADGGYLLLGPSESIGRETDLFEPISKKWRVFRRLESARRNGAEFPIATTDDRRRPRAAVRSPPPEGGFKELMQRLILDDFAPASALIDRRGQIVSMLGPLVDYLEFPAGEPTRDLASLARPGLRAKIGASLQRAIRTGETVVERDARVKRAGTYVPCSITVKPVAEPKDVADLLLVTFRDRESAERDALQTTSARAVADRQDDLVQHLERELKSTREDLQSAIEEYANSTEELKASHEEVMSANEELQSANEELESSKEELQSLNEELSTVNNQLQDKVEELDKANDDLTNLIASSDVATVFLDPELRIKRFTPPVVRLLNLRASDLDRPFGDFAIKLADETLLDDCRAVLNSGMPVEKEVWTKSAQPTQADAPADPAPAEQDAVSPTRSLQTMLDAPRARCYLRRILPYRQADQQIGGVVITLVDITRRMAIEAESRRLAGVLRDSNDAVTVQDFDGRIVAWNRGAERMYGYTEAEALRMNVRSLVPEGRFAATQAAARGLARDEPVSAIETQRICKDGRVVDVEITFAAYRDEAGRPIGAATTERDISERKKLLTDLKELNESLEQRITEQTREVRLLAQALSHLGEGVLITDGALEWPGPTIVYVNDALCRITGYSAEEMVGQTPRVLQGADTDLVALGNIKRELSAGRSCLVEVINYRKGGAPYDAELFITPLFDAQGRRGNFVTIHRDISERKRVKRALRESEQRLRAILNTAADAIISIDQRGVIVEVNPATKRMFGYASDELVGRNVNVLMPQPYRDEHDAYLARYLKTGEARVIGVGREVAGLRKDGTTFPADLAVSQVDHLGLFTGFVRDVSFRKELQRKVIESATEEQRRIGQELHDGTGQELTGLSLFAGTLVEALNHSPRRSTREDAAWLLDEAELARVRRMAGRLLEGLVEAHRHVQQLSHGIMPVQIEVEGLMSALAELAKATDSQEHIHCRFDCPEPIAVADNDTATHLYRIAQEAVNNALRHSRADAIRLALFQRNGDIVLEVSDNGVGFDPAMISPLGIATRTHGFGLDIMRYRAGMIGGTLRIMPREQGGTTVQCTIRQ